MKVPILDLKAQYQAIRDEVERKVLDILAAQAFILGPEVEALEKELAAYSGARHAVGVSSGTDGLIISLMALGIGPGDVVVTSPFSFFATAGAIARVGARPVFCDIDEATYNLDSGRLERILKEAGRVKAVLPVHLYGQCADMDPIGELAERYGAVVIEDACQSVGSEYPSRSGTKRAGAMGLVGTLSFYPSKNLSAAGDAGMVLTNDAALAEKLVALRVHGGRQLYYHDVVGGNFRLDAIQAAILRIKLGRLDAWQAKRRERADFYSKRFISEALVEEGFVGIPAAVYKASGVVNYHTYHQYVIRAEQRDELRDFLKDKEIGTSVFYPLGLHLQKCFADLGYRAGDFPVTEKVSREVLALPIYPELTPEMQDHVVFSILEFYRR